MKELIIRLWNKPELRLLARHSILTMISTAVGLAARYILLLFFRGYHEFSIFGRDIGFTIDDGFAYIVYYATGIVLLYIFKWILARGVKKSSFLPRFIGFTILYLISMLTGEQLVELLIRCGVNNELAFWFSTPVTFCINYFGSRLIVFGDSEKREAERIRSEQK